MIKNRDFISFLTGLDIGLHLEEITHLVGLFDFNKVGEFRLDFFSKSFTAFQRYEAEIRRKYERIM